MRILSFAIAALTLSLTACGGSIGMSFEKPQGTPNGTAGGETKVKGTFETKGSFNGKYTLVTTPGMGVTSCLVSVDGKTENTTAHVDTSAGDATINLTVDIVVSATATFEVSCGVKATDDDD